MGESLSPARTGEDASASVSRRRGLAASLAAVGAALLASLCCIGPVLLVTVGVGAGLASQFEPLRPVFIILTVGMILAAFHSVYGRREAKGPGSAGDADGVCRVPRNRTRDKVLLWAATLIALLLLAFPHWSLWLV